MKNRRTSQDRLKNHTYFSRFMNISEIYMDDVDSPCVDVEESINLGGYKIKFDRSCHELTFNLEYMNKISPIKPYVGSLGIFKSFTTVQNFSICFTVIDDDVKKLGRIKNDDFQREKIYIDDIYLENKYIPTSIGKEFMLNDCNLNVPSDRIYLKLYKDIDNNQKWGTLHIPRGFIKKYLELEKIVNDAYIKTKNLLICITLKEANFFGNTQEYMFILNKSLGYTGQCCGDKILLKNSNYTKPKGGLLIDYGKFLVMTTLFKLYLDKFNDIEYSVEKDTITQINNNNIAFIKTNECWLFSKMNFTLIRNYTDLIKEDEELKIQYYIVCEKKINNDTSNAIKKEEEVEEFCDTYNKLIYYDIENKSLKLYITSTFIDLFLREGYGQVIFFYINFTDKNNKKTKYIIFLNGIFREVLHNKQKHVIIKKFNFDTPYIKKFIEQLKI